MATKKDIVEGFKESFFGVSEAQLNRVCDRVSDFCSDSVECEDCPFDSVSNMNKFIEVLDAVY